MNYAAKISNFNAINMGQISDKYVGNVSWRYNMYKGGYGVMVTTLVSPAGMVMVALASLFFT